MVWDTNMAVVSLFWDTNMAAVTSCENTLYERVEILLVEVFKRGGKSVILVCERAQKD